MVKINHIYWPNRYDYTYGIPSTAYGIPSTTDRGESVRDRIQTGDPIDMEPNDFNLTNALPPVVGDNTCSPSPHQKRHSCQDSQCTLGIKIVRPTLKLSVIIN